MAPTSKRTATDKVEILESKVSKKDAIEEAPEVTLFREYLRIKSVQPDPDYDSCLVFLRKQAERLGLEHHTTEMVKGEDLFNFVRISRIFETFFFILGKPIFIMTWPGTEPELPTLLLNSHTDVVPVFPESWKYDPFEAVKEPNGDIYARGTQDMKSVGIQHIEAIHRLKNLQKKKFKRTIHLW